eukprot:10199273-Alexandrium_andersonii.AAC.1
MRVSRWTSGAARSSVGAGRPCSAQACAVLQTGLPRGVLVFTLPARSWTPPPPRGTGRLPNR